MRCRTIIKFRNSDDPNDLGFGRGIVQLLEGVEELGSINRATASMGMAYSKAWKIINSIEKEFDVRLIDREGAHGSHLTDEARALIRQYHEALDAATPRRRRYSANTIPENAFLPRYGSQTVPGHFYFVDRDVCGVVLFSGENT